MPRPSRTLTPELLRTFVLLVRNDGSVSRTAESLGINEASVSKRIKPLHEGDPPEVPRPWLRKAGKLFELTEEGMLMLRPAQDQLSRWENFVEFVSAGRMKRVNFACGQESAMGVGMTAVKSFRKKYPDAHVWVATVRGEDRIRGVALGTYDLALVTHDESDIRPIARRPLVVETLYEDPLMLACANKSSWSDAFRKLDESDMKPAAFLEFPLVLPEATSGLRRQFERALHQAGMLGKLDVVVETGGWQALLAYVREGFGVGMLPRSVLEAKQTGLTLKRLPEGLAPANAVRMICRPEPDSESGRDLNEQGEFLREALRRAASEAASA